MKALYCKVYSHTKAIPAVDQKWCWEHFTTCRY